MPDFKSRAKFADEAKKKAQRETQEESSRALENISPQRISVGTCHVCQHPFRDWIETMLIRGMAYKTLGDRVSPSVDRRSISNHYKKHMDLQDAALRAILEKEAQVQGQNYEEGVEGAITKRGVLEIALRKGYEAILNNDTFVEPRDLIQIAKVLGDMDAQQHSVGLDELRAQVQIFIQAIKNVCDQDTQNLIAEEVRRLRTRENIDQQMENVMRPQIPEAVVVEAVEHVG